MADPQSPALVPPRQGAWELERTHSSRALSGFSTSIFPTAMPRGFAAGLRNYGVLLDRLDVAVIGGFIYTCPRGVGAPEDAKGVPPRPVFAVMRRLHPEMRWRVNRALTVFRDRIWHEELALWDGTVKPANQSAARALRAEAVGQLTDVELADHIRRAAAFCDTAIENHHRFNMCALVPLGDFLVHAMRWTGMDAGAILEVFRGLTPPSAGPVAELDALRAACAAAPDARTVLESSRPAAEIIATLRARTDVAGTAVRAYLHEVELLCVGGYDVSERHAGEMPDMLVSVMRRTVAGGREVDHAGAAAAALAGVRQRVPAEHHAQFDALLKEARLTYRVRDERNLYGDSLATGLARRALLEAGRRLFAAGRLEHPEHAIDATADELSALLQGAGPAASELATRWRRRVETPIDSMPPRLGLPPSPPPPPEWLPGDAARVHRAVDTMMGLLFAANEVPQKGKVLKGFSASPGQYEGTARVVRDVSELDSVRDGDVLIAPSTSPTFNVVLPLLGAIVTERGGALCHAAIVAREYGIPGVVGCVGAIKAVRNGARVRVDGATGQVWILD